MMGLVSAISGATEQDINWKNVSILGSGGSDVEREFPCGALFTVLRFPFLLNRLALFRFDLQGQEGETALMRASTKGHTEIVQLLVDAKADIIAKDWVSV